MQTVAAPNAKPNLTIFRRDDREYGIVCRKMRGSCSREQWDSPAFFQETLAWHWTKAIADIAKEGYEFVTYAPVTLYRSQRDGRLLFANTQRGPHDPPRFVYPTGQRITRTPPPGPYLIQRTTYRYWAEGPLFHAVFDLKPAPTPLDDPQIQYFRHQNADLRELIDSSLGPANYAPHANSATPSDDLVDFMIAGIFRIAYEQPYTSLQTGLVAKLPTPDGVVEVPERGIIA